MGIGHLPVPVQAGWELGHSSVIIASMNRKNKTQKIRIFIVSAIVMLAIDLLTKYWAAYLCSGTIVIIKNWFSLHFHTNRGIALGIEFGQWPQIIISATVIGILFHWGTKWFINEKRNPFLNPFLLGIIIGGALGNLINRVSLGYVIDFIDLKPIPVFNLADTAITLGLLALLLLTLKNQKS